MNEQLNKGIGVYQIIGGLAGFGMTTWLIIKLYSQGTFNTDILPVPYLIGFISILAFSILLYTVSIIAGYLLFKGSTTGLNLSIIAQALQIPYVIIGGFIYSICLGLFTVVGLGRNPEFSIFFNADFYFAEFFEISFAQFGDGTIFIGVNVIALIIFIHLLKSKFIR